MLFKFSKMYGHVLLESRNIIYFLYIDFVSWYSAKFTTAQISSITAKSNGLELGFGSQTAWVQILLLPFSSCVTLVKLLDLSLCLFLHLKRK